MWEKHYTPPPPSTPTFEIQNQNKGIEDIMDIDSNCPSLLFGETTSHLTSKWRGTFQYFFNVESSIKRKIIKKYFSTKKIHTPPPPPPPEFFCPSLLFGETTSHLTSKWRGTVQYFFNVENSIKRKIIKKYFSTKKIHTPPPPRNFFLHQFFFFNVGNSMKREENMKYWKTNSKKTIQHTPMTWCTYLQNLEKIHQCVFELHCEN